jgi:ATP-binding cassette subfamily C (CFTR/MRP) protein 1
LIYNKILKISPAFSKEKNNEGEIINFLQVDADKITQTMTYLPLLLTVPIQLVVYSYMLFSYIGLSYLFGFGSLLIFLFVNFLAQVQYRKHLKLLHDKKDERMNITAETLNNLKVIKLYGWDDEFLQRINKKRDEEVDCYKSTYRITSLTHTLLWSAPVVVSVTSIWAYDYFTEFMNISNIFTCLNIFITIQEPIRNLPWVISMLLEALVSIKRIENFLNKLEIDDTQVQRNYDMNDEDKFSVKIKNGNFSWYSDPTTTDSQLKVNFIKQESELELKKEESVTKEMVKIGSLTDKFSNSFEFDPLDEKQHLCLSDDSFDRTPVKCSGFIENNEILVEKPNRILKNINLEINKGEFVTIIGDVGSGKSSLLKAILNNMVRNDTSTKSEIIINGKISYVSQIPWIQNDTLRNNILFYNQYDEHKYKHIIDICQLGPDIKNLVGGDMIEIGEKGINLSGGQKSRVSIARALYSDADIIILDDPISALDAHVAEKIVKRCIVKYLSNKTRILVTHAFQYLPYSDRIIYMEGGEIVWMGNYDEITKQSFFIEYQVRLFRLSSGMSEISSVKTQEEEKEQKPKEVVRITKDEVQAIGTVKSSVYFQYLKYMGGYCVFAIVILCCILWQGCKGVSDIWLINWTQNQTKENDEDMFYFWIYAGLALGSSLFILIRIILLTQGSISCANKLHKEIIEKLIRAPINLFHDQTPKGQMFNRLTKDLTIADAYNMFYYGNTLLHTFAFLGAIVICSYVELICLTVVPFILFFGWIVARFYINGSRDLSRVDGIVRSPVINLITETIPGCVTIRAYQYESLYLKRFTDRIDDYFKVKIYNEGVSQWFGLTLDLLSMSLVVTLVVYSLFFIDDFTPQTIGIMLTYSKSLQASLFMLLQALTNLENGMVSMERMLQYLTIPAEKPNTLQHDEELSSWPSKGHIVIKNYSLRYRPETDLVLKNLNLEIKPGEKVGVVGRTGSGKSTLCLGLFRLIEPHNGTIYIDDIDIRTIGLTKLRTSLTIIPQDPNLMEGTLKYNIDPLNLYSNEEICKVMMMIGFYYICENHKDGLDQHVIY